MTYLTPRRPVKATRRDCEIRGGEYILFDRSDYSSALSSLLPKARGGDPVAQTYVGEIYERGLGLAAPDYGSAAGWYRKAADSGHRPAQTSLGSLYERGLGVPRDKAVALDWYRRASGVTEDRLVFDSTLRAERDAFKKEIALRNQVAGSLRQQLRNTEQKLNRQATEVKSARSVLEDDKRKLERLTGTPQASQSRAEVEQLKSRIKEQQTTLAAHETEVNALQGTYAQEKSLLESQRRDAQSEAERLRSELHAVRELQARERAQEQSTASRAKSAQLGKLELSRKEQYEAVLDTSRRFASTP
ncbi:MAG: sel1 repeat family protein [Pseudomonadota bacterium]|nr:sel1 repeat family protein [Pseudomonadota bacterium]